MTPNDHFWGKISPQLGKKFSPVGEKILSNEYPPKNLIPQRADFQ